MCVPRGHSAREAASAYPEARALTKRRMRGMFTSPNESFLLGEGGGGLGVHRDLAFSTSFLLDNESPSHLPATSQHWLRVCDHLQGPTPWAVDDNASAQERDDDSARPLHLSPLRPLALLHELGGSPGISPRGRERDIT